VQVALERYIKVSPSYSIYLTKFILGIYRNQLVAGTMIHPYLFSFFFLSVFKHPS
jgi:hypothetical protein